MSVVVDKSLECICKQAQLSSSSVVFHLHRMILLQCFGICLFLSFPSSMMHLKPPTSNIVFVLTMMPTFYQSHHYIHYKQQCGVIEFWSEICQFFRVSSLSTPIFGACQFIYFCARVLRNSTLIYSGSHPLVIKRCQWKYLLSPIRVIG